MIQIETWKVILGLAVAFWGGSIFGYVAHWVFSRAAQEDQK